VSLLPGALAEALVARAPERIAGNGHRQQRSRGGRGRDEARPRGHRTPAHPLCKPRLPRLTLRSLSLNGDEQFRADSGRCCPIARVSRSVSSTRLRPSYERGDVAAFIVEPVQGKA